MTRNSEVALETHYLLQSNGARFPHACEFLEARNNQVVLEELEVGAQVNTLTVPRRKDGPKVKGILRGLRHLKLEQAFCHLDLPQHYNLASAPPKVKIIKHDKKLGAKNQRDCRG